MVCDSKRNLLKAAVAIGVSIGMSANNAAHAASNAFLKIGGVEGEANDDAHQPEIDVLSYQGNASKPSARYKARIKGNSMSLRKPNGRWHRVVEGRFRLSDGTMVVVRNKRIVKRIRAKQLPYREPRTNQPENVAPRPSRGIEPDEIDSK